VGNPERFAGFIVRPEDQITRLQSAEHGSVGGQFASRYHGEATGPFQPLELPVCAARRLDANKLQKAEDRTGAIHSLGVCTSFEIRHVRMMLVKFQRLRN
jgi:hypothetical protein